MVVRALFLFVSAALWASLASAQNEAPSYEKLVTEAVSEFSRGNFVEARTLFALAHERQPNARTYRGLGIVEYELREYVIAVQHFEAALADTRKKLSTQQRAEVQTLLDRARRFIGRFRLRVQPADATLSLDGRAVETDADGTLLLNPGNYRLLARAPGHAEEALRLAVRGGESEELSVALSPLPDAEERVPAPALMPAQVSPDRPVAEPADEDGGSGPPAAAIVSLAVGAAGLTTFAVAGALALAKDAELEKCSPNCGKDEVDQQRTFMIVADVGLAIGVVGAAVGAVLWLAQPDEPERPLARGRIDPWLAPGVAGASARVPF
jgi:tetratricopeptide (TPR) repeat protein